MASFHSQFSNAMRSYKKRTKKDLLLDPLVVVFQTCNDPATAFSVLQEQLQVRSWVRNDGLITSLRMTIDTLYAISSGIGPGVLSPEKFIMVAIGVLLSTTKASRAGQGGLSIFTSMKESFERIPVSAPADKGEAIMLEILSILAIATAEIKQKQLMKYVWKLVRRKELEDELQRLRLLTTPGKATKKEVQNVPAFPDGDDGSNVVVSRMTGAAFPVYYKGSSTLEWDQIKNDIIQWLKPPDPSTNYNMARRVRHKGTAEWFLRGNIFEKWKSEGSLFWIYGMPGAGKSVLCSAIIEHIESICKAGPTSMAYFAFDFKDNHKQSCLDMIPSLLTQLSAQSARRCEILSNFYSENDRGAQSPTGSDLTRCLKDMLSLPGEGYVYIIIDGIDECPNIPPLSSPREQVLGLLEELVNLRFPNLWLCVTSRVEIDIRSVLAPLATFSISLHDDIGQKQDITNYVKDFVDSDPAMRRWKAEDKELIFKTLSEGAGGMFRWASCQLDTLKTAAPYDVRRILAELPQTLDETYERILMGINVVIRKHAVCLLQCLTAAIRPLRVDELAEILAMDFDAGEAVPKFDLSWNWDDHSRAILSACSGLVDVVSIDGTEVVQFSHPSVRDFLTSERFASSSGDLASYHIPREFAHKILAQACIGDLVRLDGRIDKNNFPLAKYAAQFWVDHARFCIDNARVENPLLQILDGMKLLFDKRKPHFQAWIDIHDVDESPASLTTRPAPPRGTPLYYATLCNFYHLAKHLLDAHPEDINVRGGRYTSAIHAALYKGELSIAQLLITSRDADVNLRDDEDSTPLHIASQSGRPELVKLLLDHNADVNAMKSGHSPPLFAALLSGNTEVVQLLMDHGADLNVQDDKGSTALHIASSNGLADLVQTLLDRGAEADFRDNNHSTPLHLASANGDPTVVEWLIQCKANVNARDDLDSTPLHLALINENFHAVQLLIQNGADVNVPSNRKLTPLHLAAISGKVDAVALLVQNGAVVNARDHDESTPIHLASENGSFEVVELLINSGADVNAQDINCSSALHRASENGSYKLVKLLIDRGADVNARDKKNASPLHIASSCERPETVKLLLEYGGNPNAQNDKGWTPLHFASQEGAVDVVKCLLEGRADVNARDSDRRTPLHVASNKRIGQLLVDRGADPFARDIRNQISNHIPPATSQKFSPFGRSSSPTPAFKPSSLPDLGAHSVAKRSTLRSNTIPFSF